MLVHGFTQTRRCWGPAADDLARDHELVLVDAPGHGDSTGVDADLATAGQLVAEVGGTGTYVGYSMGGRMVLHTALDRPEGVRGLVLVGATAGIDSADERAARVADDEARAARLEQIGLEAFLDEWLALPLFAGLDDAAAGRAERMRNTVAGLAGSLRRAGTGTQIPSWDRLGELRMPVLLVVGEKDEKFTALARRMADAIGAGVALEVIQGAGHTAHLEQPERFVEVLRPWLLSHGL